MAVVAPLPMTTSHPEEATLAIVPHPRVPPKRLVVRWGQGAAAIAHQKEKDMIRSVNRVRRKIASSSPVVGFADAIRTEVVEYTHAGRTFKGFLAYNPAAAGL